jgi:hypothetical protein
MRPPQLLVPGRSPLSCVGPSRTEENEPSEDHPLGTMIVRYPIGDGPVEHGGLSPQGRHREGFSGARSRSASAMWSWLGLLASPDQGQRTRLTVARSKVLIAEARPLLVIVRLEQSRDHCWVRASTCNDTPGFMTFICQTFLS